MMPSLLRTVCVSCLFIIGSVITPTTTLANPVTLTGPTMGTSWSVIIVDDLSGNTVATLESSITDELKRINSLMSTYDPDSQLSQFNQLNSTESVVMHDDILTVVDAAFTISELTDGAYDVTIGPLIRLWGFGSRSNQDVIPESAQLAELLTRVGYTNIERNKNTLRKRYADMEIDLSSIAKGYAVDQLGELVAATGAQHFTVEIGGELLTRGTNSRGQPWRIGIEQPDITTVYGIAVNDSHMASSGSYRNYREVDGKRYSHLIDGRSGYPISHTVAAVTVLHSSTMLADAWATALVVLDYDAAQQLAERESIAALFTIKSASGFELKPTSTFPSLISAAD